MNHLAYSNTYIKHLIITIKDYFYQKAVISFFLPIFGFLFNVDNTKLMIALLLLVVMDFITGVISAYKNKEVITSQKCFHTPLKIFIYGILVSGGHLVEIATGITFLSIDELIISYLALTEFISLLENADKMGYQTPKTLLNKLRDIKKK